MFRSRANSISALNTGVICADETGQIFQDCSIEFDALYEDCRSLDPVVQARLFHMIQEYLKIIRSTFKLGQRTTNRSVMGSTYAASVCSSAMREPLPSNLNPPSSRFQPTNRYQTDFRSQQTLYGNQTLQQVLSSIRSVLSIKFPNTREAYMRLDAKCLGYLSISSLRVGLEALGVPGELINQPCFLQCLQNRFPQRLITLGNFLDMFSESSQPPLLQPQPRPNTAMSYQSTQSYASQPMQQNFPQPVQQTFNELPTPEGMSHQQPNYNSSPPLNPSYAGQPSTQIQHKQDRPVSRQNSFSKPLVRQSFSQQNEQTSFRPSTSPARSVSNSLIPTRVAAPVHTPVALRNPVDELAEKMKNSRKRPIDLFNEFKSPQEKAVTAKSLSTMMIDYGLEFSDAKCEEIISQFDINGDRKLHFLEWETMCGELLKPNQPEQTAQAPKNSIKYITSRLLTAEKSLSTLFKKMCASGGKRMTVDDMVKGLQQYDIQISLQKAQEIMTPYDKTKNGLSRAEFIRFINQTKV